MMSNNDGASLRDRAASPSDLSRSASSQSSIPSADDIIEGVCRSLHPKLEGIVHQYCDEAYAAIMESTQDYLCENALFNIGAKLETAEREQKRLYELARANNELARMYAGKARNAELTTSALLSIIAEEAYRYAGFYPPNSDGHNTFTIFANFVEDNALAQAMSAGTAETAQQAQGDSPPARSEGCAQPGDPA